MSSALHDLYQSLLQKADDDARNPAVKLTQAEKVERFLQEKQLALEKIEQLSLKRLDEEEATRERLKGEAVERKLREEEEAFRLRREREAAELKAVEAKTKRFWRTDVRTGQRRWTGVEYFGDTKSVGAAWVPHGQGQLRIKQEVVYEGDFVDGKMHGQGYLLLPGGETWTGQMQQDQMHGLGDIAKMDDSPQRAICRHDSRVCFLEDVKLGCRVECLGPEHAKNGKQATMLGLGKREGVYRLRFDNGHVQDIDFALEPVKLLKLQARAVLLDHVLGPIADQDHCVPSSEPPPHHCTSGYQENYYFRSLADMQAEKDQEAQLKLERHQKLMQAQAQKEQLLRSQSAQQAQQDMDNAVEEEQQRQKEAMAETGAYRDQLQQAIQAATQKETDLRKRIRGGDFRRPVS